MEKSKKLKIGIIDPGDFSNNQSFGGSTGYIKNILPYFSSHSIFIFGLGLNGTIPWKKFIFSKDCIFYPVVSFKCPSKLPMRLNALFAYLINRRRILNFGFDVLYIQSPEICLPFLFFNKRTPIIYHQHGSGNPVKYSKYSYGKKLIFIKLFDYFTKIIHKYSDWTIAIDQLCFKQAIANGAEKKTTLLLNAVDTNRYYPDEEKRLYMRKAYKLKQNTCAILYAGRIEKNKGFQYLVESLPILKSKGFPFHVFFAGDGTYKDELIKRIEKCNSTHDVTFLGYVPHQKLHMFYLMTDILVLTSDMEGIPMVILETFACGTPAIAYNVGGIPLVLKNGKNGKLIDNRKPHTIAYSIIEVYNKKYNRMEIAKTVESLGANKAAGKIVKIFQKAIYMNENKR